jgi:nitroreductase
MSFPIENDTVARRSELFVDRNVGLRYVDGAQRAFDQLSELKEGGIAMADVMDVIKSRRSIRRYEDKEIPEEHIQQVLEALQWSPSWANTQCWEVVVVKDADMKEKLQQTLTRTNPASKGIIQAPVVVALCGKTKSSGYYKGEATTKFGDWFMFDLGLAAQSLCLAARNLGLGTGVGDDHEVVVLIPLGYPAKDSPAPKRRDIRDFTHHDRF